MPGKYANKEILQEIRIGIRLDAELHAYAQKHAPEGNISMWIRSLIRKEMEKGSGK